MSFRRFRYHCRAYWADVEAFATTRGVSQQDQIEWPRRSIRLVAERTHVQTGRAKCYEKGIERAHSTLSTIALRVVLVAALCSGCMQT